MVSAPTGFGAFRFLRAAVLSIAVLAVPQHGWATEVVPAELPSDASLQFDPEGVLRYGVGNDLVSWDPHKAGSSRENEFIFAVYDRLVHVLKDGSYRPGLAKSWDVADDGKSFVFHLREGVKFQDGTGFDANAVKANIDRAKTVTGSTVVALLSNVDSVDVVDPLTVRLNLKRPDALLPNVLSERAGAMISPAVFDDPDLGTKPVGAGMFKLESYVRGSKAVFTPWDGYWNPDLVKVKRLEFSIMQDETARVNALLSGEIDAAYIPSSEIDRVKGSGINVDTQPTFEQVWMNIDKSGAALSDLKIRQAVAYGIDRQALIDTVEFGNGSPTRQLVHPYAPEYDPALENSYPYDPAKAKALIAESGVKDLKLNFIYFQGNDWSLRLNQAVQAQLNSLGFDIQLRGVDRAAAVELLYVKKGVSITSSKAGYPLGIELLREVVSSNARANIGGVPAGQADEYIGKAIAATSVEERNEWGKKANIESVEYLPNIPLYNTVAPFAVASGVHLNKIAPARTEFYNSGLLKR